MNRKRFDARRMVTVAGDPGNQRYQFSALRGRLKRAVFKLREAGPGLPGGQGRGFPAGFRGENVGFLSQDDEIVRFYVR
jgi:hypothetical protein